MNRDTTDALLEMLHQIDLERPDLLTAIGEAVSVAERVMEIDGAGAMLLTADGAFAVVGASNPHAEALERGQIKLGDGPGIECTKRGEVVSVDDLERDPRWASLAQPDVRAVLSAPIWLDDRPVGNLNALCRAPHEWTSHDIQALTAYAGVITACLRVAVTAGHEEPLVAELRATLGA